jgi:hypothetical protein
MSAGLLVGGIMYWLISAGGTVLLAREKRRPLREGILYGLLLGPLGVLVEICLPKLRKPKSGSDSDLSRAVLQAQLEQLSGRTGQLLRREKSELRDPQSPG